MRRAKSLNSNRNKYHSYAAEWTVRTNVEYMGVILVDKRQGVKKYNTRVKNIPKFDADRRYIAIGRSGSG